MPPAGNWVLIVDDDPDIRETLGELLTLRGFQVATAANGREALDAARARPPTAVLLDLMMPVMDGYGFMDARAKDAELAAIPVAVITAGTVVDRERLAGTTVLPKPLELRRLLEVLDQLGASPA